MNEKLQEMNFHPVFLSEKQIQNYYEGYSNSTLWPLCHYFYAYTLYKNVFGTPISRSTNFSAMKFAG